MLYGKAADGNTVPKPGTAQSDARRANTKNSQAVFLGGYMLYETFIYKGKRATSMGVELREPLMLSEAVPRVEAVSIPGRNGVIKQWDGSYDNRTITAQCYLLDHAAERNIDKINAWLVSEPGYYRFEDTSDGRHFMLAEATCGVSKQLRAGIMNPFDIIFDVDPRRYLKSGERPITILSEGDLKPIIYNPTAFPSSPLLEITVQTNEDNDSYYILGFGDEAALTIKNGAYRGVLYYDAETDRAYDNYGEEHNDLIETLGSIRLPKGNSLVQYESNYTGDKEISIKVIPRWWEI